MKRQQQGVPLTRIKQEGEQEALIPETPPKPKKMQDVYIKIHNASKMMHTNQPGRFSATSSSGNQYIMVLVEVDGNYINTEPMKNRSAGLMVKSYLAL